MPEFPEHELAEARDLARALWRAVHELVDSLGELAEINPDLDPDTALPYWLTSTAGAPETWQRTETG
jgi:hypothetical protein